MDTIKLVGENATLKIKILGRENPNTNDYWDGNWLKAEIYLELLGIKVAYATNIRVEEIQAFLEKLVSFYNNDIDKVEFTTMEEGIYLFLQNQKSGVILIKGVAVIETSGKLEFQFSTDILSLEKFYKDLKGNMSQYPLVGV